MVVGFISTYVISGTKTIFASQELQSTDRLPSFKLERKAVNIFY
jgi:hypothetical protein